MIDNAGSLAGRARVGGIGSGGIDLTGFWIAGIGINLAAFIALAWWGIRNWQRSSDKADGPDRDSRP